MGSLTITTLGEPGILHDGAPCSPSVRKTLALALYLAVTGQPHARARLCALLWPDADDAHGLLSLRQTLLRLRQALGADADAHVLTPGDLVRLDLGPGGAVDVARLEAALASQASPEQCLTALHDYRGPFLGHLHLDDAPDFMAWVAAQRAHWEACYDVVAERMMGHLLDGGDAAGARTLGQAWVAQRRDHEAAYRSLALAQAMEGDIGSARLTLGTAARVIADLGLEIARETEDLRERLAALAAPTIQQPGRLLRLPLVGRQAAFGQMRDAYERARREQPGAVLVLGEAGVGKSRLVMAFTQWAEVRGGDVAVGHAHELNGRLPYQPLMELLRARLARENAPDDLLEDSWLTELQRLVPDLHDRYPDLPTPTADAAAGARLLEAIAQCGLALARHRPLVWLIDDLHWADDATRDAVLFLLKRWADAAVPALIIVTLRREEVATTPALADWVAAVQRATVVTEVGLLALSPDHAAHALTALLSDTASPELCAWLHQQTEGNPLYLEHLLQALIEHGLVLWQGDVPRLASEVDVAALATWLPQTLRGLLLRSVHRLDVAAQQVLAAASIIGAQFGDDLLMRLTETDENTLLTALEAAERAMLIRADGLRYRFTHDTVAEAISGEISPARRRVYHRRALAALEEQERTPPAVLFRHAVGAHRWEHALRYGQRAALAAQQVGAQRDAIGFYEALVGLLTTAPSQGILQPHLTTDTLEALFGDLARLYGSVGSPEQEHSTLAHLLTLAHARADRALEWRTLRDMGWAAWRNHEGEDAARYFADALAIAEQIADLQGQAQVHRGLQVLAERRGDLALAVSHADRAVALARASGQPRLLAQSLAQLADVTLFRGSWEAVCAAIEESIVLFASLAKNVPAAGALPAYAMVTPLAWHDFLPQIASLAQGRPTLEGNRARQWGAYGLGLMGTARLHLGEGATGRAALGMAWDIFTERNEHWFQLDYALAQSLGWQEGGALDRLLMDARAGMERAASTTYKSATMSLIGPPLALVDALHAFWQLQEARAPLEQATMLAEDRPPWYRFLPATRWVTHYALAGDWSAAYEAAQHAQALRDEWAAPLPWFDVARHHETEALLRAGDRDRAEAEAARLAAALGANRRYRLVWLRMRALLSRHAGDHAAALAHLTDAATLAHQMDLPGEAWQIAQERAATYADLGDAAAAHRARAAAEAGIAALAAHLTDTTLRDQFVQAALAHPPALR